jgi:tRNA threonylcarbamoyl adenosine modification protein YjeE
VTQAEGGGTVVVETASARRTEALAAKLARALTPPAMILLDGELGAGKTTFARGFVRALEGGKSVVVQSPTFALARTYATTPPVHHLDLYRLDDAGALGSLGLSELFDDESAFCLIEWPRDLVADGQAVRVALSHTPAGDDDARDVTITLPPRFESLAAKLSASRSRKAGRARSS